LMPLRMYIAFPVSAPEEQRTVARGASPWTRITHH
jgi:hypothetical protein